ncbi:MAG: TauD/TfdA family dioxygenase [Actinomycetota bacterium]
MLTVTKIGSALGATIEGVTFDADVVNDAAAIRAAWIEHGVVFFPQLHPTPDQQMALARALGEPEAHGEFGDDTRNDDYVRVGGHRELIEIANRPVNRADFWHTDATFREAPPAGSILAMVDVPPAGGDTMWLSTAAAYDALPDAIRAMVDQLTAQHGRPPLTGTADHPVVAVHPVSGRRCLYVNRAWTNRITGMAYTYSTKLLDMLYDVVEQPEWTIRWTWSPGDVAAWDNRSTQHYAVYDYGDYPRMGHRVIVSGEAPVGI